MECWGKRLVTLFGSHNFSNCFILVRVWWIQRLSLEHWTRVGNTPQTGCQPITVHPVHINIHSHLGVNDLLQSVKYCNICENQEEAHINSGKTQTLNTRTTRRNRDWTQDASIVRGNHVRIGNHSSRLLRSLKKSTGHFFSPNNHLADDLPLYLYMTGGCGMVKYHFTFSFHFNTIQLYFTFIVHLQ